MEVELPGLSEKDVEVKLDNNLLTISSNRDEKKEEKKNGYVLRERRASRFSRSFVLPEGVDREKIAAEFKNGILHLASRKSRRRSRRPSRSRQAKSDSLLLV